MADAVADLAYGSGEGAVPVAQSAGLKSPGDVRVDGQDFSGAFACSMGGTVEVNGSVDAQLDLVRLTASIEVVATKVHRDCALDSGEAVLTLNGDPGLTIRSTLSKAAGTPIGFQSVALAGAVRWSTDDGRGGHCEVDLHTVLDPGPRTRTTTGSLCGQNVGVVETWSAAGSSLGSS